MRKRSRPKGFGTPQQKRFNLHPEMAEPYYAGGLADVEWFKAHPGIRQYDRPPFPGELELMGVMSEMSTPQVATVRVILTPDFHRIRMVRWGPPGLTRFVDIKEKK